MPYQAQGPGLDLHHQKKKKAQIQSLLKTVSENFYSQFVNQIMVVRARFKFKTCNTKGHKESEKNQTHRVYERVI